MSLIIRRVKDSIIGTSMFLISVVALIVQYIVGIDDIIGQVALVVQVICIGGSFCLIFLMVELRVAPNAVGSTTVLCVTICLVISSVAQVIAFMDPWIPIVV